MKRFFFFVKYPIVFLLFLLVASCLVVLQKELQKVKVAVRPQYRAYLETKMRAIAERTLTGIIPPASNFVLGGRLTPRALWGIPMADDQGVVLNTKTVPIRNVPAPYNATITEHQERFILFFRHDVLDRNCPEAFYTYIGAAELDNSFNQTDKEFVRIQNSTKFSEDPRLLKTENGFFLLYNDLCSFGPTKKRIQKLASVDLDSLRVNYIRDLDVQTQFVEKNWVPFEHNEEIHFEYHLNPRKILKVTDPESCDLQHLPFSYNPSIDRLCWRGELWGKPRGGSPAQKIDNEYLGFFHSSFKDEWDSVWYIMGAYTFEAEPPFAITGISNYPILFKGIYDTVPIHTANPLMRCIFPSGFVVGKQDGREVIHLACGENDSAVKIVTLDKEKLLNTIKKFPTISVDNE